MKVKKRSPAQLLDNVNYREKMRYKKMVLQGKDKQVIELSNELAKKLKTKEFDLAWK